jgi:SAM-dependent methyltransferase
LSQSSKTTAWPCAHSSVAHRLKRGGCSVVRHTHPKEQPMQILNASGGYAVRGGLAGRERLRLLSRVMASTTGELLDHVAVQPGSAWLDAGCGGGDVSFELARRVGAQGCVVGVDIDAGKLDIARTEARQQGLAQIEFREGDAHQGLPARRFDGVYARFLLSHLSAPEAALDAFRERLAPGGWLAVEDLDVSGHMAWPPTPSFRRYCHWYAQAVRHGGGDPEIGKRLPALLARAGFDAVQMRIVQPVALQGEAKHLAALTTEGIADTLYAHGLATPDEVRCAIIELERFAADPFTLIGTPRVFQVWGRRKP